MNSCSSLLVKMDFETPVSFRLPTPERESSQDIFISLIILHPSDFPSGPVDLEPLFIVVCQNWFVFDEKYFLQSRLPSQHSSTPGILRLCRRATQKIPWTARGPPNVAHYSKDLN